MLLLWVPSVLGHGMLSGNSTKSLSPSFTHRQHHPTSTQPAPGDGCSTDTSGEDSQQDVPAQINKGADVHPQHMPMELILVGTMLSPGPGRAAGMRDGEQGGGWLEMALEPATLGR